MIRGGIGYATGGDLGRHVRRLHAVAAEIAAERAMETVGAALDDEVQSKSTGRLRDVLT